MKGAYRDPIDHSRTTLSHAGESFIDTLWLPGLWLIGLGVVTIAGMLASIAYQHEEWLLPLCLISGALVTAGGLLVALEHRRVKRVEQRWLAEHPDKRPHPARLTATLPNASTPGPLGASAARLRR